MERNQATLMLARVPVEDISTHPYSHAAFSKLAAARCHPLKPGVVEVLDEQGTLYEVHPGSSPPESRVTAQYELLVDRPGSHGPEQVRKAWSDFALYDDGLVLSQSGSSKILFVQIPLAEGDCCGAFLFGSHAAEVRCLLTSGPCLLSGAADGSTKLWDLEDGSLLDSKTGPQPASILALEQIGPLMVATGSSSGFVTVYDVSTRTLMPVHRFFVDHGPVTHLAARVLPHQLKEVAAARGPRSADGGGVVPAPMGLPWRNAPFNIDAPAQAVTDTLLAVASSVGWLHVFQPCLPGEHAWQRRYSGVHGGKARVAFSPEGGYLALGADDGADSSAVLLDTQSWAVVRQWPLPSALADLLFMSSELGVFPETLSPATKLALCVCSRHTLPQIVQAKVPVRGAAGEQTSGQPASLPHLEPLVGAQGVDDALDAPTSGAKLPSDYRSPLWPFDPALTLSPARSTHTALANVASQQQALALLASPHPTSPPLSEHPMASNATQNTAAAAGSIHATQPSSNLVTSITSTGNKAFAAAAVHSAASPADAALLSAASAAPAEGSAAPASCTGFGMQQLGPSLGHSSPSRPPVRPPATLPAVRSWLTGQQAPRVDLDSIVMEMLGSKHAQDGPPKPPPQQQQQLQQQQQQQQQGEGNDGPRGSTLGSSNELPSISTFQPAATTAPASPPSLDASSNRHDPSFDTTFLQPTLRWGLADHQHHHHHQQQQQQQQQQQEGLGQAWNKGIRSVTGGSAEIAAGRGPDEGFKFDGGDGGVGEVGGEAEAEREEAPHPRPLPTRIVAASPMRSSTSAATAAPAAAVAGGENSDGGSGVAAGGEGPANVPVAVESWEIAKGGVGVPRGDSAVADLGIMQLNGHVAFGAPLQPLPQQQQQQLREGDLANPHNASAMPSPSSSSSFPTAEAAARGAANQGPTGDGLGHDSSSALPHQGQVSDVQHVAGGGPLLEQQHQQYQQVHAQTLQAPNHSRSDNCHATPHPAHDGAHLAHDGMHPADDGGGIDDNAAPGSRGHVFERAAYFGGAFKEGTLFGSTQHREGQEAVATTEGPGKSGVDTVGPDQEEGEASSLIGVTIGGNGEGVDTEGGQGVKSGNTEGHQQQQQQQEAPTDLPNSPASLKASRPYMEDLDDPPPDFISRVPPSLLPPSRQTPTQPPLRNAPKPKLSPSTQQRDVEQTHHRDQRSVAPALPYALRAPRARADLHNRLQVLGGARQGLPGVADTALRHAQGSPAKKATESVQAGGAAVRSSPGRGYHYRGYKPNMATLLKEIRSRGSTPPKPQQQRHQHHQQQTQQQHEPQGSVQQQQHQQLHQQQQEQDQQQQQVQEHSTQPSCTSHSATPPRSHGAWQFEEDGTNSSSGGDDASDQHRHHHHHHHHHDQHITPAVAQGLHQDATGAMVSTEPSMQASSVLLGSPTSGMTRVHTEGDMPPFQRPTLLSTAHLLKKMEALSMAQAPSGPGLSQVEHEEIARRAATLASNIPPHVHLYGNLQPVEVEPQPIKVQKQLHPGWVASRQKRPDMRSLWKQEEQQPEVCNTRGVALYSRPSAQAIADQVCDL